MSYQYFMYAYFGAVFMLYYFAYNNIALTLSKHVSNRIDYGYRTLVCFLYNLYKGEITHNIESVPKVSHLWGKMDSLQNWTQKLMHIF